MNFIFAIIVILIVWSLWGAFSSRVEQTEYKVVHKKNGYEIREYSPHIVAQTTVQGEYKAALNEGFRIVARYIFGGNKKQKSIAMTAPVISQNSVSEKIAMTAPVLTTSNNNSYVISFGMPRSYDLKTLPLPTDPRVKIVSLPAKKYAVLQFSLWRSNARIKGMESKLLSYLSRDSVLVKGSPIYAGYNAPWTPPWLTRNEVMVEI